MALDLSIMYCLLEIQIKTIKSTKSIQVMLLVSLKIIVKKLNMDGG
jgi:hypothetical protein